MRRTDASDQESLAPTLRYWLAAVIATLLVSLLVLLAVRSATGQFTSQLSVLTSAVATAVLLAAVWGLRNQIAKIFGRNNFRLWLPLPMVLLFAVVLTRHTANANATTVVWLIVTAGEMLSMAWWNRPVASFIVGMGRLQASESTADLDALPTKISADADEQFRETQASEPATPQRGSHQSVDGNGASGLPSTSLVGLDDKQSAGALEHSDVASDDVDDEFVTQAIVRSRALDGSETITGHVRVDFEPHEKHGSAHISFTPPLPRVPDISLEQSSGPAASISPGAVYAHGARFDLRLQEVSADPASVRFEIYVLSSSHKPPADTMQDIG